MPSRYITFVSDRQFYRSESLAEALEMKLKYGGTVYEPLGMTTAEKVVREDSPDIQNFKAEPPTEQQETTAAYVASPRPKQPKRHAVSIGDLIDRLVICNQKLWKVCEEKNRIAAEHSKLLDGKNWLDVTNAHPEITKLAAKFAKNAEDDISLCKERAELKAAISARLGEDGSDPKNY